MPNAQCRRKKWKIRRTFESCISTEYGLVSCISALASRGILILDTNYFILFLMSNAERTVQNIEWKYNVPGRDRCKKQEIRLSSVDMKILPTEQDFHLASP